ncbi:DICT sensory domain-containing protein [Iningainema tapete]|uniref:histidine kinase n=1 Tax=Iningainema tapete BLCC-T55 TaxID=2748662 RepID=A0A8J7C5R5_9CYAN|nr:DICT sensory domain-containing protein [Iningainema tapete]MBD2773399.1 ATPase [Iningainema tapete BLCC-T55]
MHFSLARELSVYQLAMGVQAPPSSLPLSCAALLSQLRAQIDLLIEQQILASLWVKLPPGKIWQSEIQRYQTLLGVSDATYTCYFEAMGVGTLPHTPTSIQVQFPPDSLLRREYFVMILSPQFCSLILAYKPQRKQKKRDLSSTQKQNKSLFLITTFEGRVIQRVFDGIKQSILPQLSSLPVNFICPPAPESKTLSHLLLTQLQRQDEINRQKVANRLAKVQQQNQKLQNFLQLKDEYLNNLCQEVRIPLTHIKTALSILDSPNLKIPQRQRYLQMIKLECARQNSLINGVLELVQLESNLEKMSLESVHLCDIVPGVVSTYQPLAQEKGIMLAYTVPTELPAVWCVSGGIKQIVIHLLSNSIKFTENGGQVWVRASVQSDYVQLEFRDTGIGIAESEITKIFERFYRVRPVAKVDPGGAGLGLTIIQQLLGRSGGSISVKSKQFEGSTFTVQLAIAREN